MSEKPEVPESLLQLERLRVLSLAYYGASRALTERANDLRRHRRSLEQEIQDLANYFDGSQPHIMPGERRYTSRGSVDATVKAKTEAARQQVAAIDAMLEIVEKAKRDHNENRGDAAAFQAAQQHMRSTLVAWGFENH